MQYIINIIHGNNTIKNIFMKKNKIGKQTQKIKNALINSQIKIDY